MWQAICLLVDQFRKLEYEQYLHLTGSADNDLMRERYRGREYLPPDYLAPLLTVAGRQIGEVFPSAGRWDIATAVAACAYGPPRIGPPPDMALLAKTADWPKTTEQLGLERLVAHGASLAARPPGVADWDHCWPYAFETLMHIVQTVYYDKDNLKSPRQKNGDVWHNTYKVQELFGNATGPTVSMDADAYSAIIRGALVKGCRCYESWEDMRLKSIEKAQEHCTRHNLRSWSRQEPLNGFVWEQAIKRNLPQLNDFRRGMLAKDLCADHSLAVYPVLMCSGDACDAEIQPDDRCGNPDCPAVGGIDRYRLDVKGRRSPWFCWKCTNKPCGILSFLGRNKCPVCAGRTSTKLTEVWLPTTQTSADTAGHARTPERVTLDKEFLGQVVELLETVDEDGVIKTLSVRTLPDGWTDGEYAAALKRIGLGLFKLQLRWQDAAAHAGFAPQDTDTASSRVIRLIARLWDQRYASDA